MKDFHEEILEEILCRLPRKSLCRFKCVSKQWHQLISEVKPKTTKAALGFPCFSFTLDDLYPSHNSVTYLRLDHEGGASVHQSISFDLYHNWVEILGSCIGLLLLRGGVKNPYEDDPKCIHKYSVYNPVSNWEHPLHPPSVPHSHHSSLASVDANHFVVVFFYCTNSRSLIHFDVYSSKDMSWSNKRLPSPIRRGFRIYDVDRVQSLFFRGAMHWRLKACLLIYHLQGEFCKAINLPDDVDDSDYNCVLSSHIWEFEGRLHFCQVRDHEINIWVLHMEGQNYIPGLENRRLPTHVCKRRKAVGASTVLVTPHFSGHMNEKMCTIVPSPT